jgi:hypothetical protein
MLNEVRQCSYIINEDGELELEVIVYEIED